MSKEKELLKKVIKILILSFSSGTILFLIIVSLIGTILYAVNKNQNGSEFSTATITDIGALGVPSEYINHYNEVSTKLKIPNWVLAAVSKQESNFNPNASYGGAFGLMQIQKIDITGLNLWNSHINSGLGEEYKSFGYKFSTADEMWNIYLKDPRAQIIAGGYMIRYYCNYVLYKFNKVSELNYLSNDNMDLIKWTTTSGSSEFKDFKIMLKRIFACYNGGPAYGMQVNLDKAENNYPNEVFQYAMEFRNVGLNEGSNSIIEKAIQEGMKYVGKSPYVWGGGRTEQDVQAGRFDCSSFVHYCYSTTGVQLGDRASVVTFFLVTKGRPINPKEMKRGDIIFFDTYTTDGHVAIYLGNNQFLHDAEPNGVSIGSLDNSYWRISFNGKVRRVVE